MILRLDRSLTLVELLVAIALLSLIVLAFASVQLFSHFHLVTADRQAQLQNEVSLALQHMNKYVSQGIGLPTLAVEEIAGGFKVKVDLNPARHPPQLPTPQDVNDDNWIYYILTGNNLTCSCTEVSASSPTCFSPETLSTHIISGVDRHGVLPANPPFAFGFYTNSTDGSQIEIGLVARFSPAQNVALDNPQVVMKSRFYTQSSAAR